MRHRFAPLILAASLALLAAGCVDSDDTSAATTRPSDAALADPGNYNPKISDQDMDITGGSTSHLDKKALKRDWDDVLNP